jgi:hypothetical protein
MSERVALILFVGLIAGLFTVGVYSIKRGKGCNITVVLTDGTILKVSETVSWRNGMTDIISCKGEKIQVPTARIKVIK